MTDKPTMRVDILDGAQQPMRMDSSGRIMWTPESLPMITQELADAFEAGIDFYVLFTSSQVVGGVVNEKPDGTLDWRPIADGWARRQAGLMTETDQR